MVENQNPIVMEEETDPAVWARTQEQLERFERNWAWLEAHASEVYSHRGKFICIASGELYVGDRIEVLLARPRRLIPKMTAGSRATFPRNAGLAATVIARNRAKPASSGSR
jgi:hypothetical protein